MTQKLPFKEPRRAHKRRNNTGRLTFHFVLFALLGVMLLSLGAYGRVKLHGIYDQQLLHPLFLLFERIHSRRHL